MAVFEVFKTERLGALTGGANVNELLVLVPPPPATVTLFVTDVCAFAATFTESVIGGAGAPAAMASLVVHVTTCPAALQLQSVPVALTYFRFGSSVSVTVIVPELGAIPPLLTTGAMPLHLTIWRPAEVWHHLGALRILR